MSLSKTLTPRIGLPELHLWCNWLVIPHEPISFPSCSQPPASPSTQEAIQGMLSMANLSSSDGLQPPWSNSQSKNSSQMKNNSYSSQTGKKAGGFSSDMKRPTKHLCKKNRKSSSVESQDYDDDQDHLEACFRDSDYGKSSRLIESTDPCFTLVFTHRLWS